MSKSERAAYARVLMAKREWVTPEKPAAPAATALELLTSIVRARGGSGPWTVRLQGLGGSVHAFRVQPDGSVEACTLTFDVFERVCPPRTVKIASTRVFARWKPPEAWRTDEAAAAEAAKAAAAAERTPPTPVDDVVDAPGGVDLASIFTAAAATASFAESAAPEPFSKSVQKEKENHS